MTRHDRLATLRSLKRLHVVALVLAGAAALATAVGVRSAAAIAALVVHVILLASMETLRTTLIADGEKRP